MKKYKTAKYIPSYHVVPLFWAVAEKEGRDASRNIFKYASILYRNFFEKEIELLKYISGDKSVCLDVEESDLEKEYKELVNDNTVLVLGPTEMQSDTDKFLCKADTVVSIAYRDNLLINISGKKHVSCYNKEFWDDIIAKNQENILNKLDMILVKKRTKECALLIKRKLPIRELIGKKHTNNGQRYVDFKYLFGNVIELNLVQYIIMDLIHFSPKQIYVVNSNLYLGKQLHHKMYYNSYRKSDRDQCDFRYAYAIHNIIDMYELTKILYDNCLFEADNTLSKVLKLGTKEYMYEMQNIENKRACLEK